MNIPKDFSVSISKRTKTFNKFPTVLILLTVVVFGTIGFGAITPLPVNSVFFNSDATYNPSYVIAYPSTYNLTRAQTAAVLFEGRNVVESHDGYLDYTDNLFNPSGSKNGIYSSFTANKTMMTAIDCEPGSQVQIRTAITLSESINATFGVSFNGDGPAYVSLYRDGVVTAYIMYKPNDLQARAGISTNYTWVGVDPQSNPTVQIIKTGLILVFMLNDVVLKTIYLSAFAENTYYIYLGMHNNFTSGADFVASPFIYTNDQNTFEVNSDGYITDNLKCGIRSRKQMYWNSGTSKWRIRDEWSYSTDNMSEIDESDYVALEEIRQTYYNVSYNTETNYTLTKRYRESMNNSFLVDWQKINYGGPFLKTSLVDTIVSLLGREWAQGGPLLCWRGDQLITEKWLYWFTGFLSVPINSLADYLKWSGSTYTIENGALVTTDDNLILITNYEFAGFELSNFLTGTSYLTRTYNNAIEFLSFTVSASVFLIYDVAAIEIPSGYLTNEINNGTHILVTDSEQKTMYKTSDYFIQISANLCSLISYLTNPWVLIAMIAVVAIYIIKKK